MLKGKPMLAASATIEAIAMRLFEGTPFDRPPKCERCGQLEQECTCPPEPPARTPPERQTARLQLEKRKSGRVVTVIRGLFATGNDLPELLTRLKSVCGAGGSKTGSSCRVISLVASAKRSARWDTR
jgi:translation initiation factor 1